VPGVGGANKIVLGSREYSAARSPSRSRRRSLQSGWKHGKRGATGRARRPHVLRMR
jgi:hypothetical protein